MAHRSVFLPATLAASLLAGAALSASGHAAPMAAKPIILKPVSGPKPVLLGGVLVAQPGKLNAAAARAQIARSNALVRKQPKLIGGLTMTVPGIASVNGAKSGNFEPGGVYEIKGHGFGASQPSVFLILAGHMVKLDVASFSDDQIFVSVPDNISGVNDAASVTLNVGPAGKNVFSSSKFGFHAAREDMALPITGAMFSAMAGAPASTRTEDGFFVVSRAVRDSGGAKHCVPEGVDTIRWKPPLKPGFELTGHIWYHATDTNSASGSTTYTARGKYDLNFDGDVVRVGYAVMRDYQPPFVALPSSGGCTSEYRVKLIVTGPRGLSPL